MTKHTPGPWGIIKGEFGPVIFSGETGAMVAQPVRGSSDDERQANARLLSAAPDLLQSLKEVVDWLEIAENKSVMHTKARAAIEKATGEQK